MKIDFFNTNCNSFSSKKEFGLCDDPPPAKNPAYIDEKNGQNWIAVIENHHQTKVHFVAIDNCITLKRDDGTDVSKCDGLLYFDDTIIFVELKQRGGNPKDWKEEAVNQLKETIILFEQQQEAKKFKIKRAYTCNKKVRKSNEKNQNRMEKFKDDTGYVLSIQQRIEI